MRGRERAANERMYSVCAGEPPVRVSWRRAGVADQWAHHRWSEDEWSEEDSDENSEGGSEEGSEEGGEEGAGEEGCSLLESVRVELGAAPGHVPKPAERACILKSKLLTIAKV